MFQLSIFICCFFGFVLGQSTLVGHLKPLGNQHPPTVILDEFTPESFPTPKQFYDNYIKAGRPAIFRNAIKETKAFKEWTDDFIKANYGDLEVRLEGKKEKIHMTPVGEKYLGRDRLRHFIDTYHAPDSSTYIVSELPVQMYKDVGVLPSIGACGDVSKHFVEIDLWWSGGGSRSIIHKDAFNQLNCLYRGTKYWKIFQYKYEKWLYKHWEPNSPTGGFSEINVDAVDLKKHPNFLKVPWSNFTINAGDCLFLPKSDYHQVNSDGPNNLAVSILFGRFDNVKIVNFSDCTADTDYQAVRPLSDFDVMWQWEGKGDMSMGYADHEEAYRSSLLDEIQYLESEGKKYVLKNLEMSFGSDEVLDGVNDRKKYKKAFDILDTNKDGVLSEEEIKKTTFKEFRSFGLLIEPYEPSNTYRFEYSFIPFSDIYRFINTALQKEDEFKRERWVSLYKEKLGGTADFAQEIYNGIVQSNTTESVKSKEITSEDIHRALANWKSHWAPQYSGNDDVDKLEWISNDDEPNRDEEPNSDDEPNRDEESDHFKNDEL